jgi:hypothetical protein
MRRYLSGSTLPLVQRCGAAAVLPQVKRIGDKDRMGSAWHEHMDDRAMLGISGAVSRLGEIAESWHLNEVETSIFRARAMSFEWSPPRGAMPEIALCLCEDGRVEVVRGGRGTYEGLPPDAILPTQIDVFWAEPEPLYRDEQGRVRCPPGSVLIVGDYKSGLETYVDPVERNAQALASMVIAARWTGAQYAQPAIIFIRKGKGLWDMARAVYDAAAIDMAEQLVRSIVRRGDEQRALYQAGQPLTYVTGRHCTYCDSEIYCAAKTAVLKRYMNDPAPLDPTALTADQAQQIAALEAQAKSFATTIRAALVCYAQANGQVTLPDGKQWGPYLVPESDLDPAIALSSLGEEIGPEAAALAMKTKITKGGIDAAIAAEHKRRGIARQKAPAVRRVLGRMRAAGVITDRQKVGYGLHAASDVADPAAIVVATERASYEGEPIDGDEET